MPNDDDIANLTIPEMQWLVAMIEKDEEEEQLKKRDELEYLASFINYRAVEEIRSQRNVLEGKMKPLASMDDDEFLQAITDISEREAPRFQD